MRTYLDHNATMPLRPEARAAMIEAMELVGNPSSVHAEGRAAKGMIERARQQVAEAIGADGADIIFTSGATEAAGLACAGQRLHGAEIEHDAVASWIKTTLATDHSGQVIITQPEQSVLQLANSETGVIQALPSGLRMADLTQAFGKIPLSFNWLNIDMALISAHKIGGPKGVGALVIRRGIDISAQIKGGGQEMGRRSGTENVIGIAGFGAAAMVAAKDLADGGWSRVEKLRNILETMLADLEKEIIFVGNEVVRLPNTSCFIAPSWKGETQVMALDLAGFAVSAGSACSSGKVRASRVLRAMGYDDALAASAIRVSLGPDTTQDDIERFATCWGQLWSTHCARVAR